MDKLSFIANGREVQEGGAVKLSLSFIKGKVERLKTNELPIIFNALKRRADLAPEANECFTYTFPFTLARGRGFPYVFDFDLDDDLLTLT